APAPVMQPDPNAGSAAGVAIASAPNGRAATGTSAPSASAAPCAPGAGAPGGASGSGTPGSGPPVPSASCPPSDIPAASGGGPTSTALFADLDLGAGAHRATVTLEPADVLPQDDQFYTVVEHREPRALIIGANASGDDVSYFAAAVGALTNPRL